MLVVRISVLYPRCCDTVVHGVIISGGLDVAIRLSDMKCAYVQTLLGGFSVGCQWMDCNCRFLVVDIGMWAIIACRLNA